MITEYMSLIFLPNSLFVELIAKKSKEVSVCTRRLLVSFSDKAIEKLQMGLKGPWRPQMKVLIFRPRSPKIVAIIKLEKC